MSAYDAMGLANMGGLQQQAMNRQYAQATATTLETPQASAARNWKDAAERLERARQAMAQAEIELREASDAERGCWCELEAISGRQAPPPATPDVIRR